ncbi:unnamed protein product [Strongylus vulgaris]|uniref:Uncharacterized protein n=1 Tax=Strongylus vulgaris TaxID=40348 RepID=A0A3P7LIZ4_STRVU|nr:unnamed protein product [Strongylus vulgaris]
MASFRQETLGHSNDSGLKKLARAMGVKRAVRDSSWWSSDEDEDYEYYLWKKYRREKIRRRLMQRSSIIITTMVAHILVVMERLRMRDTTGHRTTTHIGKQLLCGFERVVSERTFTSVKSLQLLKGLIQE